MTRARLILTVLLLLALSCLAASCASGDSSDTSGDLTTDTSEASGPDDSADTNSDDQVPDSLDLSAEDDGGSFVIQTGGTIVLTLEANPSTGFAWEMNDPDPEASLLAQVGEPIFTSDNPDAAGAGGTVTYTFMAADPGEMTVSLIYMSPGVDEAPTKTFEFDLTVK